MSITRELRLWSHSGIDAACADRLCGFGPQHHRGGIPGSGKSMGLLRLCGSVLQHHCGTIYRIVGDAIEQRFCGVAPAASLRRAEWELEEVLETALSLRASIAAPLRRLDRGRRSRHQAPCLRVRLAVPRRVQAAGGGRQVAGRLCGFLPQHHRGSKPSMQSPASASRLCGLSRSTTEARPTHTWCPHRTTRFCGFGPQHHQGVPLLTVTSLTLAVSAGSARSATEAASQAARRSSGAGPFLQVRPQHHRGFTAAGSKATGSFRLCGSGPQHHCGFLVVPLFAIVVGAVSAGSACSTTTAGWRRR